MAAMAEVFDAPIENFAGVIRKSPLLEKVNPDDRSSAWRLSKLGREKMGVSHD
jgi:hypothetical protein